MEEVLERRRGVNHYGESNKKGEHVLVPVIRNAQKVLFVEPGCRNIVQVQTGDIGQLNQ